MWLRNKGLNVKSDKNVPMKIELIGSETLNLTTTQTLHNEHG